MAIFRCKALLFACALAAVAADRNSVDWRAANAEALRHFRALLRFDTSNPPGHETIAATYLETVLRTQGIAAKLLALDPDRANLVARIPATAPGPHARPIVILGHTDVVGVDRSQWSVDPFGAARKSGYVYGRGAVDDKCHVTAGLMLMLLLQRRHMSLKRDIIFVAEAGEEGAPKFGIDYLVAHHWPEIAAEFALAEGGAAVAQGGEVRYVAVTTAEKTPRGVRLIARGPAGHASRPTLDNAVTRLAAAVAKAGAWHTPLRLNDTTRAYFDRLASISPPEDADRYRHVSDPARAPEIDRYFERDEPSHYAMIRTTVAPTQLNAGIGPNIIPSQAEAYLDIRALPDEDISRFYSELRALINDPGIEIAPRTPDRPATAPSRLDTVMFRALEHSQHKMFPHAITLPAMSLGATDLAQLRARGVQGYGYGPMVEAGDPGVEAHANGERLPESALYKMIQFLWYAVLEAAT